MTSASRMGSAFVLLASALLGTDPAARGADWQNISDEVVDRLKAEGKDQGPFPHSGGVAVDPATGDVYLVMCDQGIWKSVDQGATFARIDDGTFKGRCETGGAFNVDPNGSRMALATVYGPSALISDRGESISLFGSQHFDYVAVDWPEAQTMLAFRHESGETLAMTRDGGKTWEDLGKGFSGFCIGLFDAETLIASRGEGILRSVDRGKTWSRVSEALPTSPVVVLRDGVGYLLTKEGLLVTKNDGAEWSVQGAAVDGAIGPVFDEEASHMFILGDGGVFETKDAGATWSKIASQPADYPRIGSLGRTVTPCLAYDAQRKVVYVSRLGFPAYKLQR